MSNKAKIEHKGTVKEILDDLLLVKIVPESSCQSCRAKMFCGADGEEKIIEVSSWDEDYETGESVMVMLKESLGFKALFYGYIAPFLVILFSIVFMLSLGLNEGLTAIISLLLLAPYYGILYLYKDKLKKEFTFSIRKNYF
jgi:sigma-E factor negative regulatory protein RseC